MQLELGGIKLKGGNMRKLDILIPVYNEDKKTIKCLLDSIQMQQSIDFHKDIGVIICCDGGDAEITAELLNQYPYPIEYHYCDHHGVSATRNACLDFSTAEYVMFCDADDMFFNDLGLYFVLQIMKDGFDSLNSTFIEEARDPNSNEPVYASHEMDTTFVHGKVHKRQYLIDNNIRWNDNLTIHEDSYFNILCLNLTENVKYCETPFYLWKWRDDSVCRHDSKYILKTYNNMIDSIEALINELIRRKKNDKASFYIGSFTFDAYYTMNKPEWIDQENQEYRNKTEQRFSVWFKKHKDMWENIPINDKMVISNQVRSRSVMEGMRMEAITIDNWLKHIESLTE